MFYYVQTQTMMVKIKKGKRFIPGVGRIYTLGKSAVSPKASEQTIQQTPSARKKNRINKQNSTKSGILLLEIALTVS